MKKIAIANTVNETNQIARGSPPANVPSGTDSMTLATIRVLQKKSAIIRTFSTMSLTQFILQRVYHTLPLTRFGKRLLIPKVALEKMLEKG
jgi:hypothetical protein